MSFQMEALIYEDLRCPECGQVLIPTNTRFNVLYEHSQEGFPDANKVKHEQIHFSDVKYDYPVGEVTASFTPRAPNYQKPCKNEGKYLVRKKVLVGATSL